jgi:putative endonuclease
MQYGGSVYIMTNATHTVLYIGVTANLYTRVDDHKNKRNPESFTAKYNCCKMVYYENYSKIEEAIAYEKSLKNWHREWKINLINKLNPTWKDLIDEI